MFDPSKTPGTFGAAPADAPHEVTDGTVPGDVQIALPDGSITSASRMARQYEQELPAYAPKPMTVEQMASYLGKSVEEIRAMQAASGVVDTPTTKPVVAVTPNTVTPTKGLVDPQGHPISSQPPQALQPLGNPRSLRHARPAVTTPVEAVDTKEGDAVDIVPVPLDVRRVPDSPEVVARGSASGLAAAAQQIHARGVAAASDADGLYRPAASNTDSPSRGVPQPSVDRGKQITGGFGDTGEAMYYPLDGLELKKVIELLLEKQRLRIQDDLRFSMAATYPRVRARCLIEVECFAADASFTIANVMVPPHEKTPIDVARRHGDEVCFCVISERMEMTDDQQSVTPPNAMRLEVGLPIPRKHAVSIGGRSKLLVDVDQ